MANPGNPIVPNRVSVVIPVYNRSAWIEEALHSVFQQTHSDWEVLVCDDGSSDGTPAVVDRLAEQDLGRIRVFHLPHRGPGPTREYGRSQACGEFIQYLDSDDRLCPGKFAGQIAALRAQPECGIAYGRTRLIDKRGTVLAEPFKWTGKRMEHLFPGLLVDRWWCTHTPLYRREATDRIGPWSDLRYSQDWEYDARAGALGTKLVYIDQLVSEHREHDEPERQTGQGHWLAPADQLRFFQSLYTCAIQACVALDCPEMRHFSRWVFMAARRAGRAGDPAAAEKLLDLARQAHAGRSTELVAYRWLAGAIGWRAASSAMEMLRRALGRKAGRYTQSQSWMGGASRPGGGDE